jgi:hypothetical protein
VHPHVAGKVQFANPVGPGWADPETGRFDDPRMKGRDNKPYGPLPRAWAQYKGLYHFGNQVIVSYTVGSAQILEMPAYELTSDGKIVYSRTLNVGKSPRDLLMRVAPSETSIAIVGDKGTLAEQDGYSVLRIPAEATPLALKILISDVDRPALQAFAKSAVSAGSLEPFSAGPKSSRLNRLSVARRRPSRSTF